MTWYDDNERISYPLLGEDDGAIPADVLVDILLHAPSSLGSQVEVSSIAVTGLVVSVVLSIAGTPVAYATVENSPDLVQVSVPLVAITPGASGFVVFGSGIQKHRLNITGSYPVMDSCVILFEDPAADPTLRVGGHAFTGQVQLKAGPEISITAEPVVIQGQGSQLAAVIRLAPAAQGEPVGAAYKSAEANLRTPPIRTINGIPPPLTIEVIVVKELPTEAGVVLVEDVANHAIRLRDLGAPCT